MSRLSGPHTRPHMEGSNASDLGHGTRQYMMRSPLFGQCDLIPQDAAIEPTAYKVGYVELEGAEGKLLVAMYQDGQWRTRNLKPFSVPVTRWYKVVKADGTEPF